MNHKLAIMDCFSPCIVSFLQKLNSATPSFVTGEHGYTFSTGALPKMPEGRKIRKITSSEKAKTSS